MSDLNNNPINIHSFLIVLKIEPTSKSVITAVGGFAPFCEYHHENWSAQGIEIIFNTRSVLDNRYKEKNHLTLLLGDAPDLDNSDENRCLGHGSLIQLDLEKGRCKIISSIVGLPPVYVYEIDKNIIITSDLSLLASQAFVGLDFDFESIFDLCRVGHTTRSRTLFKHVNMLPCGHIATWAQGRLTVESSWQVPREERLENWSDFCAEQINTFMHAVEKMEVSDCFLSLTAGLDTRAVLAAVYKVGKQVSSSYTISGVPLTLDARRAIELCRQYGIKHQTVILDDNFLKNLDVYALKASHLSGGIHSIQQAHEVFFYESVDRGFTGRLSGNMGNQIGRGGTEGVSMRNANPAILNSDLLNTLQVKESSGHWFNRMKTESGALDLISLLQNEIPNSSVGNYSIGNYYAVQKSPYAYRGLMEKANLMPLIDKDQSLSLTKMRLMDLKHRFLGDSQERSFQRKLIVDCGGPAAHVPINWGWRPTGGVSLPGVLMGGGSIIDAFIAKKQFKNKAVRKMSSMLGVDGLHVYTHPVHWLRDNLKDFCFDNIMAKPMEDYFNHEVRERVLNDFFYKEKLASYNTVCFALDLSLANKAFRL